MGNLINSLQNGERTQIASKANVTINTGNGHSNIKVTANNVSIDTGCGDQDIQVRATGNLDIDTGFCGEDTITAVVGGNANITTREDNDTVNMVVGGNFNVDVGMIHPECGAEEDDDKVTIVSNSTTGQNYLATGQGNDTVNLIANNVDVNKADGSLEMGFVGNNYNINSDATKNLIAGWGDNVTMNLNTDGRADNKVYTFDQLWSDPNPEVSSKFTSGFWQTDNSMVTSLTLGNGQEINFENVMDMVIGKREYTEKSDPEVVSEEVIDSQESSSVEGTITTNTEAELKKIADKYGFNLEDLKKFDFSQTMADGSPKYVIYRDQTIGAVRGTISNTGYLLVEKNDKKQSKKSLKGTVVALGANAKSSKLGKTINTATSYSTYSNYKDLSVGEQEETQKTTITKTDTIETKTKVTETDILERQFDGVKDWQVNMGNGKVVGHITARDGYININHGDACNNEQVRDLVVDAGYITREVTGTRDVFSTSTRQEVSTREEEITSKTGQINLGLLNRARYTTSPLVLDTNNDGKVSAEAGKGVDLNNDGKADGAATNGDKMLAMTDLNGNGKVDGAEVFGDQTVSPFTGKKLNAANGFEALKQIAQEAKQYTGIDCMNGSKVDVKKLEQALAQVGIKLGYISDENTTNVENLYGVKEIEVGNYKETASKGEAVEHLQQSVYTDENGVEYKVDDVWFEI